MNDSSQTADIFVTVVMPLYNKELYVGGSLASVLGQSHQNFELIVINDGSTDGSADVVEQTQDSRVRLISQANQGVSKARNNGVLNARENLIAFIDADDIWYRDHLKYLLHAYTKHRHAGLFCNRFVISQLKENITFRDAEVEYKECRDYANNVVRGGPVVWTSAAMIRKDVFWSAGGFPEGISHGEDIALWIKASRCAPIVFSTYIGALYNQVEDGLTSRLVKYPDGAVAALNEIIHSADLSEGCRQDYIDMRADIALSHVMTAYRFGDKKVAAEFLNVAAGSASRKKKFLLLRFLSYMPSGLCRICTLIYIKIWRLLARIRESDAH
jgi:glycosyltransferase involved in cell wall biosynthesis